MTAVWITLTLVGFLCWWVWQLRRWDLNDKPRSMPLGSPEQEMR